MLPAAPSWKPATSSIVVASARAEPEVVTSAWLLKKYPSLRSTAWVRSSVKETCAR